MLKVCKLIIVNEKWLSNPTPIVFGYMQNEGEVLQVWSPNPNLTLPLQKLGYYGKKQRLAEGEILLLPARHSPLKAYQKWQKDLIEIESIRYPLCPSRIENKLKFQVALFQEQVFEQRLIQSCDFKPE
jgi:hypothetical protein